MTEDEALPLLLNLPPLKEVIAAHDLWAKKSLGQHFLLESSLLHRIVRGAGDISSCPVIEIGPGPGGLTRALLEVGAPQVIAIEQDARCVAALASLAQASQGRLTVVEGDALQMKLSSLGKGPFKIVANLPYNIASALLVQWLEEEALQEGTLLESLTLMFQKEVALRLTAVPSTKDYGRLSILTQWLCQVEHLFDIPPGAFTPPPKVISSVVHLKPRPLSSEERTLLPYVSQVTRHGFGQRRKMVRSSLKELVTQEDLMSLGINPQSRAEELGVKDYLSLARLLSAIKICSTELSGGR